MVNLNRRQFGGLVAGGAAASVLVGCGAKDSKSGAAGDAAKGQVYFLNFKPESDETWKKIAVDFTKEKSIPIKVVTAASGTYEQTLKAELSKSDAPTLFQINGPVGLKNWQAYALDVTDAQYTKDLLDPALAVESGGKVYGVPYVEEGYGIIYNDAIMKKYFGLSGAKAKDVKEINSFAKLKEVADDMQARKAELGIEGVFACTSLKPGEEWRWQTHLADLPVYQEYADANVTTMTDITFKYNKEFKQLFDLYLTDSTVAKGLTTGKSVTDSMAEFALGKCAMVQNGNWAWSQIAKVAGNTVKDADVKFMPIYMGLPNEKTQGLCIGTENFFSVNAKSKKVDQDASIAFVNWLVSSESGKKHMVETLGFIPPFKTFDAKSRPSDPLGKEVVRYLADSSFKTVPWVFTTFPSAAFKQDFGAALGQYANDKMSWDDVVKTFVKSWKANQKS